MQRRRNRSTDFLEIVTNLFLSQENVFVFKNVNSCYEIFEDFFFLFLEISPRFMNNNNNVSNDT